MEENTLRLLSSFQIFHILIKYGNISNRCYTVIYDIIVFINKIETYSNTEVSYSKALLKILFKFLQNIWSGVSFWRRWYIKFHRETKTFITSTWCLVSLYILIKECAQYELHVFLIKNAILNERSYKYSVRMCQGSMILYYTRSSTVRLLFWRELILDLI